MSATASATLAIEPGAKLEPVANIFERLTGSRPHPTSIVRWCGKGIQGIPLPSLIVQGRRMSAESTCHQWIEATTAARAAR